MGLEILSAGLRLGAFLMQEKSKKQCLTHTVDHMGLDEPMSAHAVLLGGGYRRYLSA